MNYYYYVYDDFWLLINYKTQYKKMKNAYWKNYKSKFYNVMSKVYTSGNDKLENGDMISRPNMFD